ncbi:hypothetical protein BOTBODRAFT_39866 [Botryobasidium botryosum FD-172 SS1]|uniref:Uncharacterized protein n=1 Tax=Botryobasidium botryosum (strain FD-172 SS1) TaxID=930990 RepID=A0A067LRW9_BOTB1|nr:hypothetical protein BOTBODRAFT_39866 [Botryobasidium botryosum FD-172 SS1]
MHLTFINLLSLALVASAAPLSVRTSDYTALLRHDFVYPPDIASYTPPEKGYSAGVDIGHEVHHGDILGAVESAVVSNINGPLGLAHAVLSGPGTKPVPSTTPGSLSAYSPEVKSYALGEDVGHELGEGHVVHAMTDAVETVPAGFAGLIPAALGVE